MNPECTCGHSYGCHDRSGSCVVAKAKPGYTCACIRYDRSEPKRLGIIGMIYEAVWCFVHARCEEIKRRSQ